MCYAAGIGPHRGPSQLPALDNPSTKCKPTLHQLNADQHLINLKQTNTRHGQQMEAAQRQHADKLKN
eukprot:scaffold272159_cov18-Tisochrysis_lutea.AAC.1